jgi:hypothetical protein
MVCFRRGADIRAHDRTDDPDSADTALAIIGLDCGTWSWLQRAMSSLGSVFPGSRLGDANYMKNHMSLMASYPGAVQMAHDHCASHELLLKRIA